MKMLLVMRGGMLGQEEFVVDFKVARSSVKHDPYVSYDSLARFVGVRTRLCTPAGRNGCEEAAHGVWD